VSRLSFAPREWGGAFADLGVSVPVLLALAAAGAADLQRALLLFGAVYVAAGLWSRLPMPVQPLKAATAVVIARGLGGEALAACALWISGIFLLLSLTGLIERINKIFTLTIVRGVQLGTGLLLLGAAWKLLGRPPASALAPAVGLPGLPSAEMFWSALFVLVIPQLPMTLGNSVAATCAVSRDYFGPAAERVTPARVSLSIALSNLAAGLLGGLPVCHGSGGVTAHYKFGARTGGAPVIIGAAFILLALLLGREGAALLLGAIPGWVLAAMLAWTGLLHAGLAYDRRALLPVVLAMGLAGWYTKNLSYSLLIGLAAEAALLAKARSSREAA
jgi:sulfate permease, SulP family